MAEIEVNDCVFCKIELDPRQQVILENEHCIFLQYQESQMKGNTLEGAGIIVPRKHRPTQRLILPEKNGTQPTRFFKR